jgi:hypothetical protein
MTRLNTVVTYLFSSWFYRGFYNLAIPAASWKPLVYKGMCFVYVRRQDQQNKFTQSSANINIYI